MISLDLVKLDKKVKPVTIIITDWDLPDQQILENEVSFQLLQMHAVILINLKTLHSIKEMLICWNML